MMSKNSFVKHDDDKKKNTLINGLIIVCAIILVGALGIVVSNNKKAGVGRIKEISYSEYQEKIKEKGVTIVLLASPTCGHCNNYKPFVNALAEENNFDVYYVNVNSEKLTNEEYDELHDSISALKEQFGSSGEKVIPTPTTIIFRDGNEVVSELGDIGYDGLKKLLKNNGVI